jgi:dTDP-4-dehydrorhamnose reductase
MKKILIFGANGMLGSELAFYLAKKKNFKTFLTVRKLESITNFKFFKKENIFEKVDATNNFIVEKVIKQIKPDIVVNCIGIIKQNFKNKDLKSIYKVNSFFPKYLSYLSNKYNFRCIHFSTDCVFSGEDKNYAEKDFPDARDYYGISKFLGENMFRNNVIIRTSFIGHNPNSKKSLLEWFLSQKGSVKGYAKSVFSGFTTYELADLLYKYFLKNKNLNGLYHISSKPISKYELLSIIKKIYEKKIKIVKDIKVVINRSLNSKKFKSITKYKPRSWENMIKDMHKFRDAKINKDKIS